MDHAVDLFVQFEHGHSEHGPAALGFHELNSKVVDWMAVAQPLCHSFQRGLG